MMANTTIKNAYMGALSERRRPAGVLVSMRCISDAPQDRADLHSCPGTATRSSDTASIQASSCDAPM